MEKKQKRRAWIIWSIVGVLAMLFFSAAIEVGEYTHDCNSGEIIKVDNKSVWVCANETDPTIVLTTNLSGGALVGQIPVWNGTQWVGSTLEATLYNATSINAVAGTLTAGTLANTRHNDGDYDGITLNITESAGSPALDIRINFTDSELLRFDTGIIRYKTTSLTGNEPIIQLWNYDSSTWEDYPTMIESPSFITIEQPIFDDNDHIDSNIVQMRIYKATNGNINNKYYIDWLAISAGYGTPTGDEADPYSLHKDGSNKPTNDLNWGNTTILGNMTISGELRLLDGRVVFQPYSKANPFARAYLYDATKSSYIRLQSGGIYNTGLLGIQADGDINLWAGSFTNNGIKFGDSTTTTPYFYMGTKGTYAGRYSIGTITPLAKFHLQETHDATFVPNGNTDFILEDTNNGYPILELAGDSNNAGGFMVRHENEVAGAVNGYLRYDLGSDYWSIWTNSVSRVTIDNNGNVTATGNMVANDFITASKVADFSSGISSLDKLNNANDWLNIDGSINYEQHYAHTTYTKYEPVGVRQVNITNEECYTDVFDKAICEDVITTINETVYEPFEHNGLSMETRVAEMEKMIHELNEKIKVLEIGK